MSSIDLVILGHLLDGPKSAYEMKKELETQHIRNWVKIGIPTIFQNTIKLHQKGYLDAVTVKEGEMPEKTIYTVNENGKAYFHALMKQYSGEINSIYFDFCAVIDNLGRVDKNTGLQMIEALQKQFHSKKIHLNQEVDKKSYLPVQSLSLIKLYYGLFSFLDDWSEELRQAYQKASP